MDQSEANQSRTPEARSEWITPEITELPLADLTAGALPPPGPDAAIFSFS